MPSNLNPLSLNIYRYIGAIIVVFFHYGRKTEIFEWGFGFWSSAPSMLSYFFLLSGFVLTLVYLRGKQFDIKNYFVNRVGRIVPIYLVAMLLCLFLIVNFQVIDDIYGYVLSLFFLQSWFPPYAVQINPPAWSLSVEIFFYLLFPVVLIYLRKVQPKVIHLALFTAAMWVFTQLVHINLLNSEAYTGAGTILHQLILFFPLSHMSGFLLGMTLAYGLLHYAKPMVRGGAATVMTILTMLLVIVALICFRETYEVAGIKLPVASSFFVPLFLVFIWMISRCDSVINRFMSNRLFVALGDASYAVYILQAPAVVLYQGYVSPRLGLPVTLDFLVFIALLTGLGLLSFYCFETPVNRWIRKRYQRRLVKQG